MKRSRKVISAFLAALLCMMMLVACTTNKDQGPSEDSSSKDVVSEIIDPNYQESDSGE